MPANSGGLKWNGQAAKPAREVKVGDTLKIKNPAGEFVVEVLGLSEMRGPAAVAQTSVSGDGREPRSSGTGGRGPEVRPAI